MSEKLPVAWRSRMRSGNGWTEWCLHDRAIPYRTGIEVEPLYTNACPTGMCVEAGRCLKECAEQHGLSDTPRTDALLGQLKTIEEEAASRRADQLIILARQLERELANEQIVRRAYEAKIEQLERDLASIIARAKAECEGWNCKERWDRSGYKDGEYCPNCPYELVTRKDSRDD